MHKPRGTTPRQVIHEELGVGDLRRPSQEQLDALPPGGQGWDIPWRDRLVVGPRQVLAASFGLRVAYLAVEDTWHDGARNTWIAVYLMGHYPKDPWYNFGYKDIEENTGSCERSCPERVLKAVDPFPPLLCSDEEYQHLRKADSYYEDDNETSYAWLGANVPGLELCAAGKTQEAAQAVNARLRHVDGGHGYARQ